MALLGRACSGIMSNSTKKHSIVHNLQNKISTTFWEILDKLQVKMAWVIKGNKHEYETVSYKK